MAPLATLSHAGKILNFQEYRAKDEKFQESRTKLKKFQESRTELEKFQESRTELGRPCPAPGNANLAQRLEMHVFK